MMLQSQDAPLNILGSRKNVLLQKDDVGQRKRGFHDLPGPEFTYGRSDHSTIQDGVGNLVSHWKTSKPSASHQEKVVDFKKLNRAVIGKRGQTSTRNELRTNPTFMIQKNKLAASGQLIIGGPQAQSNTAGGFGKANRPSTPIKGVLSNNFGNRAEQDLTEQYGVLQMHQKQQRGQQKQSIGKNRALLLKEKYDQETRSIQQKKQFVMKRFAEVNARTNSHNVAGRSIQNFQSVREQAANPK